MKTPGRPTLRCLREDLGEHGPDDPGALYAVDHPIVAKAAADWPDKVEADAQRVRVSSVSSRVIWRVKTGRWRGAVWVDALGQPWLVAVGYREEGSGSDFYATFGTEFDANPERFLPSESDYERLNEEAADVELERWERSLQATVREIVERAVLFGMESAVIHAPDGRELADLEIEYQTTDEPDDDLVDLYVEVNVLDWSRLEAIRWAELVILTTINPSETDWDASPVKGGTGYSLIMSRVEADRLLDALGEPRQPGISQPGSVAHYAHRHRLTEASVNGDAVRALCGSWFVPRQDHESLGVCPTCEVIHQMLPS